MRDIDVRTALHSTVLEKYRQDPDSLIVDELGVCQGSARIDVAVINGALHGYEIKSDRDTLERLPAQLEGYRQVFDTLSFVVGTKHLEGVERAVPDWCGLIAAEGHGSGIELDEIRRPGVNPSPEPFAVAQLLWRSEALAILEELDQATGLRSRPRRWLWKALADYLDPSELSRRVRDAIRARTDWREGDATGPVSEM